MVKTITIIYQALIYTVYKTLLQNVIRILPITYQNKAKRPEKNRKCPA